MSKVKITLITIGHARERFNIKKIKNIKSKLFNIESLKHIDNPPKSNIEDGYLDVKITQDTYNDIFDCLDSNHINIGITINRFDDGFYMHRVNKNNVVISLYSIEEILSRKSISIENFIKKQIYEIVCLYLILGNINTDEIYEFVHEETKGCLFDYNGQVSDIIYNTEKPLICIECQNKIDTKTIEEYKLITLKKELKKIKKPFFNALEYFVSKHPLISILLSIIIAKILDFVLSRVWEIIIELYKIILEKV